MRINRRLLYWGVFLATLGGVLVVADLGGLSAGSIADALRLWPLAIVAIGAGLVLRRTRFGLAGGMLAAAVPGLVIGGAFSVAPRLAVDCGAAGEPTTVASREGTFDGPARVTVTTACGTLDVTTAAGSRWELAAGNTSRQAPTIDATSRSLSIETGGHEGWHGLDGRNAWRLTLPTTAIEELSLVVNAGEGTIDLPDAAIGGLDITTNAARTTVDLSQASVSSVTGTANAGALFISLPATSDITGSLKVNAAELRVCVPESLGVRLKHAGVLNGIRVNGLEQTGGAWQSANYTSAAHRADLTVNVNLGSVEINPIGGCR